MKRIVAILLVALALPANAQTITINANSLLPHVEVSFSPRAGSFVEGSTFDVPILINTHGAAINGVDIKIAYDASRLTVIKPSSGTSIVGVWVEPPAYDNTRGTASYVGVIPNGITTNSGLLGTITFQARRTGPAAVSVRSDSSILLNDGLGTQAQTDLGRATYTVVAKAPEGVQIFSDTHPFQDNWYNNNSPIMSWVQDPGVTGFSYGIDHVPSTVPGNTITDAGTTKGFENLGDGLWYFHIKAYKNGVWGTTGHFLVRIDTAPPAEFKPRADYVVAAAVLVERTLLSFFTTDSLSGIDHYEVGVIDKSQPTTVSPVFVQTESPFQVPAGSTVGQRVIVRAVDKAGNIRDASVDIQPPLLISRFIQDYLVYILAFIVMAGLVGLIIHYLVGHHILRHIRRAFAIVREEEQAEEKQQNVQPHQTIQTRDPEADPKHMENQLRDGE